ncbi:hypothetical protein F6X40_09620 [Paraburkholderia sp. UCT31]|uniref:hypothetical protein n=1 Tax=Paraburkholderia sp. UCT31 TaxID=2615209 RepID=UPI0016550C8D|nr:hypothetical protein [Paraburkholderia sp. UCT31]MBC8737066.1 hypothetical protein [Paraburkholderia sp. UCT31]
MTTSLNATVHIGTPVPRQIVDVPGHAGLRIHVIGVVEAANPAQEMEQAYFVELNGNHVARAELLEAEKAAVRALLVAQFPQHAAI